MGRPPSNGGPAFRFTHNEVAEMEAILRENDNQVPGREVLAALSDKFSQSAERASGGKLPVQVKQVWNWFQNRRYALRSKMVKAPGKLATSSMPVEDAASVRSMPHGLKMQPTQAGHIGRVVSENSQMEFEAKSARDGAWYDVQMFLSHRFFESGDPEVLVRFAGFGPEEDEWVNVRKHVRQRSLPCESTECIAVLQGDLVLSFQEGKEQALYFDAHVLDAQRRRHDVRGCRCRFLVRYDHDQSEEIVPLRKICRRPETDYRMQQLNMAKNMPTTATTEPQKFVVSNPNPGSTILKPPANHPNVAVQTYQKITVNPNSAGVPVSVQTSMGVSPVNVIPELQKVGSGNPMVSSEISGNKATIVSMGMPSEMAKQ